MTTNPQSAPVEKLRDGSISATIWRNESERGPFYSVTFDRVYTDANGQAKSANSFSGPDLLRVSHLANTAYGRINTLKAQDRVTA